MTSFLSRRHFALLAAVLWLPVAGSRAQDATPATDDVSTPAAASDAAAPTPDAAANQRMHDLLAIVHGFKPRTGAVRLPNGLATLNVPAGFCFLEANDSYQLLVDVWRNPPGTATGVLGMILPTKGNVPDVRNWGVVVTYEAGGYVKDSDADSINYDELLKKMQASTLANNARRQQAGYPPMELVGWAAPPRYDKAAKKLYWAQELKSGDGPEHTLNYDVRILGRTGVLSLNAVAGISQLAEIEVATPKILSMVEFDLGHRYVDFNPKTDKVAAYGLAALVAGGLLAKAGGFKLLLVALLAAKKFVIIGVVAVIGFFKKIFGGKGVVTHEAPPGNKIEPS